MSQSSYSRVKKYRHFHQLKKKESVNVEGAKEKTPDYSERNNADEEEVSLPTANEITIRSGSIVDQISGDVDVRHLDDNASACGDSWSGGDGDCGSYKHLNDCISESNSSVGDRDEPILGGSGCDGDSDDIDNDFNKVFTDSIGDKNTQTLDKLEPRGMEQKINQWAVKFRRATTAEAIDELLAILRSEGYTSIPKTTRQLLQTPHCRHLTTMRGVHEIPGEFIYLGIASGLRKIISTQIYRENDISLLVHIDGMQVYRNAKKEIWPISIKIQHPNYTTKPFAAAIYCGDGKPLSATEFMTDFVEEANELQENGLRIDDKVFEVKIVAIVADSPARAFICCHKAPGAFYACGRCFTKGITVGCGRRGKRIYPVTNANLRTKVSYETRVQPEHHYEGSVSPLLSLDRFDLTKQVPLDLMHLFYSGNMKWLLDKWLTRSSAQRIKLADVRRLDEF
ncbi:uncharacterized protein LOC135172907 [Diachasmimorpha longicaudata]|uniref:uncharacterized protein LOC135159914 n=1 Tax=Diachasmimorpha longicaudata TaxID=58733 RepID=UPI0030B88256